SCRPSLPLLPPSFSCWPSALIFVLVIVVAGWGGGAHLMCRHCSRRLTWRSWKGWGGWHGLCKVWATYRGPGLPPAADAAGLGGLGKGGGGGGGGGTPMGG